jgi:hypothetical protein
VVGDGRSRLLHSDSAFPNGDGIGLELRTLRDHCHGGDLGRERSYNDRTDMRSLRIQCDGAEGDLRYRNDGRGNHRGGLRNYDGSGGTNSRNRHSGRDDWRRRRRQYGDCVNRGSGDSRNDG